MRKEIGIVFGVLLLLIAGIGVAVGDGSEKIQEIRMVTEVVNITPIEKVASALEIVSVRQWDDLGKDEEIWGFSDFKVYEVTLHNTGDERIYFYPVVYTDTTSSTNLKLRKMEPGEVGTISTSTQLSNKVSRIIVAIEDITSYKDYGPGYNNPKETQIFSLDTEKLQPPEWLWEASIESRVTEKLDESRERLGEIKPRIAEKINESSDRLGEIKPRIDEKLNESSERLGEIKPRIDEKIKELRWRLACSVPGNHHGLSEYYRDYPPVDYDNPSP